MPSRRQFLTASAGALGATLATSEVQATDTEAKAFPTNLASLCGEWLFRTDSADSGKSQHWYGADVPSIGWRQVNVPHTWEIEAPVAEYYGTAWDRRTFDVPADWRPFAGRVEVEAVFHTATVWINGQMAGEHRGKGYTAFTFDVTHLLHWGETNTIAVRVDNAFNEHMLPRGRSSDWAHDGGIFRPVQLLITPRVFVERGNVEATPNLSRGDATIIITSFIRNTSLENWNGKASHRIVDEGSGLAVLTGSAGRGPSIKPGTTELQTMEGVLTKAKLWHFDHPNLY